MIQLKSDFQFETFQKLQEENEGALAGLGLSQASSPRLHMNSFQPKNNSMKLVQLSSACSIREGEVQR